MADLNRDARGAAVNFRDARSAAVNDRGARSAAVTDRDARSAAVTDRDARSAAVNDRGARSAAVNDRDARSAAVHERRAEREAMVAGQLAGRGVRDPLVLAAMSRVQRECFVDERERGQAYGDFPLPIGFGQTISQPFMVAYVVQLLGLRGDERVLDVGAGSGYQTAVLSEMVPKGRVYAVERIPEMAAQAAARLATLGYPVEVACADGTQGWPQHAPYDAIAVAAGAPKVPEQLLQQLADGGRMVVPVGTRQEQRLMVVRRHGEHLEFVPDIACVYVDLIGRYGWTDQAAPR